jgi:histidine triad (HIT) family protein
MASIFTRILTGELPGHFIWKDEHCFAILTIQPIRRGHVIVIPNAEIDHWDDVPAGTAAHMMQVSQHIAKGIKQVEPCTRVGLMVVGLEVPHTHLHVMPIDSTAASREALEETAVALRSALQAAGFNQAAV